MLISKKTTGSSTNPFAIHGILSDLMKSTIVCTAVKATKAICAELKLDKEETKRMIKIAFQACCSDELDLTLELSMYLDSMNDDGSIKDYM